MNRAGGSLKSCSVLFAVAAVLAVGLAIAPPAGAVTINEQARTVTAARVSMAFGAVGPDVVKSLQWTGSAGTQGANLVANSGEPVLCGNTREIDPRYFWGQSYGDGPEEGNPKLVLDGSAGTWTSPAPDEVQTRSEDPTECTHYAAPVPVTTTYTYYDAQPQANEIVVQRTWNFSLAQAPSTEGATGFRAYVPQLPLKQYGQVLYPNAGGLQTQEITPKCSPKACVQEFSGGWFAINDATAGDPQEGSGVIVLRDASDMARAELAIQGLYQPATFPQPL